MAIEKLDKSELYGFPVTDLETATAEETAGGITLPVIVVSNGVLTYKVVATKTWSDYVATTTEDAISAANAKVDAAVKDSQAKTAAAVNSANDAATRAGSAAQDAQVAATAYQRAKSEVEQLKTDTAAMEQRVAGVGTTISNAEAATAKAESAAKYADEKAGVADIAAKNADATVSELKQLSTDFVGKTMGVPTEMRLEYLKEISLRNDVLSAELHIPVRRRRRHPRGPRGKHKADKGRRDQLMGDTAREHEPMAGDKHKGEAA